MKNDCLLIQDAPLVLFVTPDTYQATQIHELLQNTGWRVGLAANAEEASRIAAAEPIALLAVGLDDLEEDGHAQIRRLRAATDPNHAIPIVALTATVSAETDPKSSSVDGVLPPMESGKALARALDDWRPLSLEPTRRIVAMFGSGPIAGMMERLARRLEAAMVTLERGQIDKAEAHRLAGLCGTLGFAQAHAAWLDVSLGEEAGLAEARRTTRLTLAAIARGL